MNFRTTAILIGAVAVLVLVLLFVNRETPAPQEPSPTEATLLKIDQASVTRVTVTPSGGQPTTFEKSGADWRMTQPYAAPADTFQVDNLVRAITGAKSTGQVEVNASNAGSMGLDSPRYVVEVTTSDGKTRKVNIGAPSAVGGIVYARMDGAKEAEMLPQDLWEQLEKPASSYRQTRLVNVPSSEIKQIEITRPSGKMAFAKTGVDWKMTEPQPMPADPSEMSSLNSAIAFLTAAEFVAQDQVPAPVNPANDPRLTVQFSTQAPATQPAASQPASQPAPVVIKFGGYDSILKKNVYVWVSNPPAMAKVAATSMDIFNKKPIEFRDRRVVDVDPEQVSSISILTEHPAATQPTTKPADGNQVVIERKKENTVMGPEIPNAATRPATQASTQPATGPATQASTQPALPPSKWTLASAKPAADASQSTVESLLSKFHPLRAQKYLEAPAPATQPSAQYTIILSTQSSGGASSARHEIKLTDPGQDKPLVGHYNGLAFELDRSLLMSLTGDFANKPEPVAPQTPEMPDLGGSPGMPAFHP